MTNWVTIKIPETTRDDASDDPRTYEEIMRAGLDADTAESDAPVRDVTHTPDVTNAELMAELDKVKELADRAPDRTADKVEERLR